MSPTPMYTITAHGPTYVVTFRRDIFDAAAIEDMRRDLRQIIDASKTPQMVIDCENLRQVSSLFLGALMELTLKLRGKDKAEGLRICRMSPQVHEVFGVMRLDEAVRIHPTLEAALASFPPG